MWRNPITNDTPQAKLEAKRIAAVAKQLRWRIEGDLLVMPHYAPDGRPVGERVRKSDGTRLYRQNDDNWTKHPDARLYHAPGIRHVESDTLYLLEGESDVASMIAGGYPNSAGVFGVTNIPADLDDIVTAWGFKRVVTLFDADQGGETGRRLVDQRLDGSGIALEHANAGWIDCNDINDLWLAAGADTSAFQLALRECIELSRLAAIKPAPPPEPLPLPIQRLMAAAQALDPSAGPMVIHPPDAPPLWSEGQIASVLFAYSNQPAQAMLTLYLPQIFDNLPAEFTAADIHRALPPAVNISERALRGLVKTNVLLNEFAGKLQFISDVGLIEHELHCRVIDQDNRRRHASHPSEGGLRLHDVSDGDVAAHKERRKAVNSKPLPDLKFDHTYGGGLRLPDENFDSWWWGKQVTHGATMSRDQIMLATGWNRYKQAKAMKAAKAVARLNIKVVKAETKHAALEMAGYGNGAYVRKSWSADDGSMQWRVQGANTYAAQGTELASIADGERQLMEDAKKKAAAKRQSFDPSTDEVIKGQKIAAPILPDVPYDALYTDESFVTVALWRECVGHGWINPSDFAGKQVTIAGIFEKLPTAIPLPDGTAIPF